MKVKSASRLARGIFLERENRKRKKRKKKGNQSRRVTSFVTEINRQRPSNTRLRVFLQLRAGHNRGKMHDLEVSDGAINLCYRKTSLPRRNRFHGGRWLERSAFARNQMSPYVCPLRCCAAIFQMRVRENAYERKKMLPQPGPFSFFEPPRDAWKSDWKLTTISYQLERQTTLL